MDPKGFPACVLFCFCDCDELPGHGPRGGARARLCAHQVIPCRRSPRSNAVASGPDIPSLPSPTGELQPRSPSSKTPKFQPAALPNDYYLCSLSRHPSLRGQITPCRQFSLCPSLLSQRSHPLDKLFSSSATARE